MPNITHQVFVPVTGLTEEIKRKNYSLAYQYPDETEALIFGLPISLVKNIRVGDRVLVTEEWITGDQWGFVSLIVNIPARVVSLSKGRWFNLWQGIIELNILGEVYSFTISNRKLNSVRLNQQIIVTIHKNRITTLTIQ